MMTRSHRRSPVAERIHSVLYPGALVALSKCANGMESVKSATNIRSEIVKRTRWMHIYATRNEWEAFRILHLFHPGEEGRRDKVRSIRKYHVKDEQRYTHACMHTHVCVNVFIQLYPSSSDACVPDPLCLFLHAL